MCTAYENNQPLYIVLDTDLSGGAKTAGDAIKKGAELAIDTINAQGGVLGRPLELLVSDHRGNPSRGISHINQLDKQQDILAVLGGVHTPVVMAQLQPIHQQNLLFMIPWAAGTSITDNQYQPNNVFRISIRDAEAATTMLSFTQTKNISKVTLILERTGWGRSNYAAIKQKAMQHNIQVEEVVWFNWRQKGFDKLLQDVSYDTHKAFVFVGNGPEGVGFIQALSKHQTLKNMPVISHWGISAGDFSLHVGESALNDIDLFVLQPFHFSKISNDSLAQQLLFDYRQKYDNRADFNALTSVVGLAHAYDIVTMLAHVAKQVDSIETHSMRTGLEQLDRFNGLVKVYIKPFDKGRDALLAPDYLMTTFNSKGYLVPVDE